MKKRVKLLTLWFGELPPWFDKFKERMDANGLVDWVLLFADSVSHVNDQVTNKTQLSCRKKTAHALCDVRPLFMALFPNVFYEYEWWGWCDLDIVVGGLEKTLGPHLDSADVISTSDFGINGPMTLLRNCREINGLWKEESRLAEILADPEYRNWDETGFQERGGPPNGNPSFTKLVQKSGLRTKFLDVSWDENRELLPFGLPARCCQLFDGKLLEVPTNRELALYHFTSKVWPIPNRFKFYQSQQEEAIVKKAEKVSSTFDYDDPSHWDKLVHDVIVTDKPLHCLACDCSSDEWGTIQKDSATVLKRFLKDGDRVFDVACGPGMLLACLERAELRLDYNGVDQSPGMILLAKGCWPNKRFIVGRAEKLEAYNDTFDWCVCRGLEGSVKSQLSTERWDRMLREMLRVAPKVLLIDHSRNHSVVERGRR